MDKNEIGTSAEPTKPAPKKPTKSKVVKEAGITAE